MENKVDLNSYLNGPMWNYFRSPGNHVVIPRAVLCGMPWKWQEKFAKLMDELRAAYDPEKFRNGYMVRMRGDRHRIGVLLIHFDNAVHAL